MTLSYDTARCGNGDKCPKRNTCQRWLDKGHPTYQVFASLYIDGDKCHAYIPTETYPAASTHGGAERVVAALQTLGSR